jgi:prepilin-type N-terminal cleavage/methylation domain-containing protein
VRRNEPVNDAMPRATRACKPQPEPRRRSGFTLVEVLVVILIVGMLAGLLLPAVMQALARARTTAIKAEIDMLHMAIMNYKNEYGSFPPLVTGGLAISGTDPASRHLLRLFPRISGTAAAAAQIRSLSFLNIGMTPLSGPNPITPSNALPMWLYGYTNNPTQPVFVSPTTPRQKLYDFDVARLSNIGSGNVVYHIPGKPNVPYIYINAASYGPIAAPWTYTIGTETYQAQTLPTGAAYFNADTFQILCAGRDEEFGTDDDLSNFWPSTRRAYLDSLNAQ